MVVTTRRRARSHGIEADAISAVPNEKKKKEKGEKNKDTHHEVEESVTNKSEVEVVVVDSSIAQDVNKDKTKRDDDQQKEDSDEEKGDAEEAVKEAVNSNSQEDINNNDSDNKALSVPKNGRN